MPAYWGIEFESDKSKNSNRELYDKLAKCQVTLEYRNTAAMDSVKKLALKL